MRSGRQYRWVARMARAHDEYGADWVVNTDAAELFVARHDRPLKEALCQIAAEASVIHVGGHDFDVYREQHHDAQRLQQGPR